MMNMGRDSITLAELSQLTAEKGCLVIDIRNADEFDYAHNDIYREKYDLCVSRAVANLSTLSEYCIPYVKVGGKFVSYKAGECEEEINSAKKAVNMLGGKIEEKIDFILPETDISRTFIVIGKLRNTSIKYPRKSGLPSKEPLK